MHDQQSLKCEICQRTFSKKSSRIRHAKICSETPRQILRQKSCRHCASIKGKCDLKRPSCGRCVLRKVSCRYPVTISHEEERTISSEHGLEKSSSIEGFLDPISISQNSHLFHDKETPFSSSTDSSNGVEFSFLEDSVPAQRHDGDVLDAKTDPSNSLSWDLEPTDAQWSLPSYPSSATIPPLTKHTRELQLPPIIHAFHVLHTPLPEPLSKCYALTKVWYFQNSNLDIKTAELIRVSILKEIQSIVKNYHTYNTPTLLASLQALTLHLIMLLFPSPTTTVLPSLDPSIFASLQALVNHLVQLGLVLPAERTHTLPPYLSWITISSTRRCILTIYMIHWCYSIYHCLPSFVCSELNFMPAPAAKMLWNAQSKEHWTWLYERWLQDWGGDGGFGYLQGEFMMIGEGIKVDGRTERWLEEADEFGVMFMSLVNAADKEPIYYGAEMIEGV